MENNFVDLITKYFKNIDKPISNQNLNKLDKILKNTLYKQYMVSAVLKEHSNSNNITNNDYILSKQLSPIINISSSNISNELNFYELFENTQTNVVQKSHIKNILNKMTDIKYELDDEVLTSVSNDLNNIIAGFSKNI